jgi:hypothetical protein
VNGTELRQVVLDLGMEDLIPLWDVAGECEAAGPRALADERARSARLEALIATLVDLFQSRHIRVFVAPWQIDDPSEAVGHEAEALIRDRRRYFVDREEAEGLERVYYVNVENLPY